MFMDLVADPREGGPSLGDEGATLSEFLRYQRLTLHLKCEGLDAAQLACRAVEPSTMSLLGLLRHMAEVERGWFRRRRPGSLRELLVHMIEEYARHNGHADLLRERIDGRIGQ